MRSPFRAQLKGKTLVSQMSVGKQTAKEDAQDEEDVVGPKAVSMEMHSRIPAGVLLFGVVRGLLIRVKGL